MMAGFKDFRRMALGLKGAIEGAHHGHPDFRLENRIFATLHPDLKFGMVKVSPDEQKRIVREHPEAFVPENGAWGRQGCTRVELAAVDAEVLGEALTLAWQTAALQNGARKNSRRRKTAAPAGRGRRRAR